MGKKKNLTLSDIEIEKNDFTTIRLPFFWETQIFKKY